MAPILQVLDAEWQAIARSPEARRSLIRWARDHDALVTMRDLHEVVACRRDREVANEVHLVLAQHARHDHIAVRTLLQTLLPGIIRLVGSVGYDDPDAADELIALAWERIRTYPSTRRGSVAANVVLDVRKRYTRQRRLDRPGSLHLDPETASASSLPEDQVIASMQLREIVDASQCGIISREALEVIIRTRVGGESLAAVAADEGTSTAVMCQRRWRAEQRLRSLPLAG
jgi:DNA-directed RNA polymerase specialized sigma24 family protein